MHVYVRETLCVLYVLCFVFIVVVDLFVLFVPKPLSVSPGPAGWQRGGERCMERAGGEAGGRSGAAGCVVWGWEGMGRGSETERPG